jgi:hypothetical protein
MMIFFLKANAFMGENDKAGTTSDFKKTPIITNL